MKDIKAKFKIGDLIRTRKDISYCDKDVYMLLNYIHRDDLTIRTQEGPEDLYEMWSYGSKESIRCNVSSIDIRCEKFDIQADKLCFRRVRHD